ncbi:hypothetical protein [Anthocerotibacter panamensis]|uniref:hypothetical protein n=1 Tax=Anthocerotibacter panamensis TaxID=2857077 RepID=UPI001C402171|nr:hypothetical protein [Anthocerotibacter panamensis]
MLIPDSSNSEIEALLTAFETCTLPRDCWTHSAHLVVALVYLHRHPYSEAMELIRNGIQHYNRCQGSQGYHETMTRFWIILVQDFRLRAKLCINSPITS